jgi:DNA modification methylase
LRKYSGEQESVWGGVPECEHEWSTSTRTGGGKSNGKERWNHTGHGEHGHASSLTNVCGICGAWRGAYGLEPTLELYIQHTIEILRECRRVLRKDGICFFNLGDSYAANRSYQVPDNKHVDVGNNHGMRVSPGLKPKDLCLIPQRVAIAAQADGWWVRSMIVWAKPNPMPESCTDRPTDAYEHIIMLTKSERYYWDADAVREPAATGWNNSSFTDPRDHQVYKHLGTGPRREGPRVHGNRPGRDDGGRACNDPSQTTRNIRNVWTFATQPYSEAHFATFPEELPRRCILAATSAKGACEQCGAPWERILRSKFYGNWNPGPGSNGPQKVNAQSEDRKGDDFAEKWQPPETIGWAPTCRCKGQRGKTVPCMVLDPFGGSGTTGRVAIELGRRAILVDLSYEDGPYQELAERRTHNVQMKLAGGHL